MKTLDIKKLAITVGISLGLILIFVLLWTLFSQPYKREEKWLQRQTGKEKQVNVFYVGDTSTTVESGNAAFSEEEKENYKKSLENQLSPFEEYANFWIPYYRQASALDMENKSQGAMKKAYKDVKKAFSYYLATDSSKEPLILAGDGQGGVHVLHLLEDFFQNDKYKNRLVCAYIWDSEIPKDFKENKDNIPLADAKSQNRVIVTERENIETRLATFYRRGITSQAEFVEALGGLDYASARDGVISLKKDITVAYPIVIANGTYIILGRGHTITRDCDEDLFALTGDDASNMPILNFGDKSGKDKLVIDGAGEKFGKSKGALLAVYGRATLNLYKGTILQNNDRQEYGGGAVYGECSYQEREDGNYICLEPRISVFGAEFINNKSQKKGGAIAVNGAKSNAENKTFGQIAIFSGTFKGNTAEQGGNQVYTQTASLAYSPEIVFEDGDLLQE